MSLLEKKVVPYRGCTIEKASFNKRFFNKSMRGGGAWSTHTVITWNAFDEEGNWLSAIFCRPLMRDCKKAIDKHIRKQEEFVQRTLQAAITKGGKQ